MLAEPVVNVLADPRMLAVADLDDLAFEPVTLGFSARYRAAKVYTLESERVVRPVRGELGIEVAVGEFSSYAAVEVQA